MKATKAKPKTRKSVKLKTMNPEDLEKLAAKGLGITQEQFRTLMRNLAKK